MLERWKADLANVTGEQVAASLGGLVSDVDKAALTGEFAPLASFNSRQRDFGQTGSRAHLWLASASA